MTSGSTGGQGRGYFYPNKMGRIVLLSMEETMGRNGVNAILNLSKLSHRLSNYPPNNFDLQFSFEEVSALQKALEEMYGPRGGRGLALRTGRACFKYSLKEFGPALGISDLAFRLLPLNMKLKSGAQVFTDAFNKFSDQRVTLVENSDSYLLKIERCPVCWGRKADSPCCNLVVGLVQEALLWVSGGKNFNVAETSCIACGDPCCTIEAEKQPLD